MRSFLLEHHRNRHCQVGQQRAVAETCLSGCLRVRACVCSRHPASSTVSTPKAMRCEINGVPKNAPEVVFSMTKSSGLGCGKE